jgi:hypothetical protein
VSKITLLNVATPATAATLVVDDPAKPPGPATVKAMVSVEPVPLVMVLPKASSTDTLKVVRAVPAVPVAGGSGVKAR